MPNNSDAEGQGQQINLEASQRHCSGPRLVKQLSSYSVFLILFKHSKWHQDSNSLVASLV